MKTQGQRLRATAGLVLTEERGAGLSVELSDTRRRGSAISGRNTSQDEESASRRRSIAARNATKRFASSEYDIIRETFGQRIKTLQYRYERDGHKLGGIHVLGGNRRLNPILIFGDKA